MRYEEYNLEAGLPTGQEATELLMKKIGACKKRGVDFLLVIHGYGSSGKGGVIRTRVRARLSSMKEAGRIRDFVPGEEFDIFHFNAVDMKNKCRQLEPLLRQCNPGVTVVEL